MRNKEITTCMHCLYFDAIEDEKGFVQLGLCKINAPDIRGFPRMRPQDGCGEGRLDENRILPEETITNYEILNSEEYQEPEPYIRVNEILPEQEAILNEMYKNESEEITEEDQEIINKILGEEDSQKKTEQEE